MSRQWTVFLSFVLTSSPALASDAGHGSLTTYKWINFAILAAGIGYLVVKFMFPAFRSQQREILQALDRASKQAGEAAGKVREADARLAQLESDLTAMRQRAEREMEAEARRVEEETKAAIAKIEHGAEVEIAAALHAARQELARTASELALDLARRKVSERMNPALQAGLVDEFSQRLNERAQ